MLGYDALFLRRKVAKVNQEQNIRRKNGKGTGATGASLRGVVFILDTWEGCR